MAARYATTAEVRSVAPEFGAVDGEDAPVRDTVIERWAGIAARMIGLCRWGDDASDGHALLTAHLVTVSPDGEGAGSGGPMTAAGVGPVSASFATAAPVDELLSTSHHGRAYMALRTVVASTGTAILSNTAVRLG